MQDVTRETSWLFVYGTLLPRTRHPMAMRLAAESIDLGDAAICGRLYDLGAFPGVVLSNDPGERVHGAVVKLLRPRHSFRWIDAYEGCGERDAEPHGFQRVIIGARLMSGRRGMAWVYAYRGGLGTARRLQDGRYYPAKSLRRLQS